MAVRTYSPESKRENRQWIGPLVNSNHWHFHFQERKGPSGLYLRRSLLRKLTSIHNSSVFQQNSRFKTIVQMNPDWRTRLNANKWVEETTTGLSLICYVLRASAASHTVWMGLKEYFRDKVLRVQGNSPKPIIDFSKFCILSWSTVSVQSVLLRRPWHFRYFVKPTKAAIKISNSCHNSYTKWVWKVFPLNKLLYDNLSFLRYLKQS